MTVRDDRMFELTATVNFPTLDPSDLESFAQKLDSAVGSVLSEYVTAVAFMIAPDLSTGDINYGIRFSGADPRYIADMADEILQKAVELVAEREGTRPIEAEREESVLVLA